MSKLLFYTILIGSISIFAGCDNCGENVKIGEYSLMETSVSNYFPFIDQDHMVFRNEQGKSITLVVKTKEITKTPVTFREICNNGFFDSSQEFFDADFYYIQYATEFEGTSYSIDNYLYVNHINDQTSLTLFDQATFNSLVFRTKGEPGVGGTVSMVASYRGNHIPDSNFEFLSWVNYADSLEIRGQEYKEVWYFLREGIPSLYVQKQKGVIAFLGFDGELWVRE